MAPETLLKIDGQPIGWRDAATSLKTSGYLPTLVDELVEIHLIREAAAKANFAISDADLQAESDGERQRLGLFSAADTNAWLAENGLTPEDWEHILEYRLLRSRLAEKVGGADAIQVRFAAMEEELTLAALWAITVDSQETADEILDQVRGEEARFSDLARRHSRDEDSRKAGGMIGWVPLSSLPRPVAATVRSSKAGGEIVGPVQAGSNWYVLSVEAIEKPALSDELKAQIRDVLLCEWVAEERKRRKIEVS